MSHRSNIDSDTLCKLRPGRRRHISSVQHIKMGHHAVIICSGLVCFLLLGKPCRHTALYDVKKMRYRFWIGRTKPSKYDATHVATGGLNQDLHALDIAYPAGLTGLAGLVFAMSESAPSRSHSLRTRATGGPGNQPSRRRELRCFGWHL